MIISYFCKTTCWFSAYSSTVHYYILKKPNISVLNRKNVLIRYLTFFNQASKKLYIDSEFRNFSLF